ncbi:arpA protein [Serratia marcescens]|uniref:Fe2OG dioxygenase domain-containing protein n=1 Tax=Serratia marcescens SM39 TaxID=1334564 RepID=A0AAT9F2F7_SERMA|nr:2OG-Fe(II) oxygenase [Serratia marcescens]MBN5272846.1 2OG-Fe(II) oxygenase [Serratia marcescens]MBN5279869.1 2OG-Fe(II) oxygenase [Serratia marcescens]MBN5305723.1 2OG-Fe(II) oxygenase [Serratia marcescens]MBN5365509.1 2OG-Fe(II) oxygenase [Serratia marcescens]MBN5423687.1 2OG-Fe(II) oxygenase [Serratia marcescens]
MPQLADIIDLSAHPIDDAAFRTRCRQTLERSGALVLPGFLRAAALATVRLEGAEQHHAAFYATSKHNVYLRPQDDTLPADHARNRLVVSSKGCITDEDIPPQSPLRALYDAPAFRAFLCAVLDEAQLYPYADRLSSINLHYAHTGQELGWHFDNSSFAITLLIQKPAAGGRFEYVENLRDADRGEMNYAGVTQVLDGERAAKRLAMEEGDLVLFRGRNAMHRVTPTEGDITRMLVVLAYNAQPDVMLSESARMTFYGRL